MTRRFFAPVLVSGVSNAKTGEMTLYVTSDRMTDAAGVLNWHITDTTGKELVDGSINVQIPSRSSAIATKLQLGEKLRDPGAANLLAWIDLQIDGQTVSSNLLFFVRPGELNLVDPKLTADVSGADNIFDVTLHAEHPALWAWIELEGTDATYSENFLHVRAEAPVHIQVRPAAPMSMSEFKSKLRVRSVVDLYAQNSPAR
jgi:beta-mannosidase